MGVAKYSCGVVWAAEMEGGFQDLVQKIVILIEVQSQEVCVNVLEVGEGNGVLKKNSFDPLQCHENNDDRPKCYRAKMGIPELKNRCNKMEMEIPKLKLMVEFPTEKGICASLTKALAVRSRDAIASVSKCGFEDSARALSASVRYLHGHCYTTAFQGADEDLEFSAKRRFVRVFFSTLKPKYCKVDEASMDVEDGNGIEQRNNVNEVGMMSFIEGFHQWQQQHCMISRPPYNTTTPLVWYR
ncbi:hypothetical protein BUALT_Bualt16G0060500 [Buddleja alternifolia]|uniref:Uncharacterized protein n=1 Tax=Buddleja alternifolia TaxID=168488 RepID=A0AAV6WEW0_9LAMI|nr:hypothetical protein BUALT_Bualt16G0060500 [Buddleja alternifolia]